MNGCWGCHVRWKAAIGGAEGGGGVGNRAPVDDMGIGRVTEKSSAVTRGPAAWSLGTVTVHPVVAYLHADKSYIDPYQRA